MISLTKKQSIITDTLATRMVGSSQQMRQLTQHLLKTASATSPVLLCGEVGSGKTLSARFLHQNGPYAGRPLHLVNCAAPLQEQLCDQLFNLNHGLLSTPSNASVVLEEIDAIDPALQAKLLQALSTQKPGEVQLVCTSRFSPEEIIKQERIRPDLFYRLSAITLNIPPLRARGGDVTELAYYFMDLRDAAIHDNSVHLSPEVIQQLIAYNWPGNVRELKNMIQQAVMLNDTDTLTPPMLPIPAPPPAPANTSVVRPLSLVEREVIEAAIAAFDGNIPRAAIALGVAPSTIYRKQVSWNTKRRKIMI